MQLDQLKTLTGLTLTELATKLDAELPSDAYKAIAGTHSKNGGELTDIDPNYMNDVLTACFGPAGVGFGFEYTSGDMHVENTGETGMKAWVAYLTKGVFWYALVNGQPEPVRITIDHSGGSINARPDFAAKGAITSALAGAASRLGFQKSVYLGKRSHVTTSSKKTKAEARTCSKCKTPMKQGADGRWGHRIDAETVCYDGKPERKLAK